MPNLIKRIQAAYNGLKSGFSSGDWVSSNAQGNRYNSSRIAYDWNPGTNLNYAALAGDLWNNSACQSVLNWIIRAWPESYPCVKQMQAGKKIVVDDHPLTAILMNPNEFDDDTTLWGGTIISFWCDGNAYWRINRTRGGQIGEFEYVPHWAIHPYRAIGSISPGPEKYILSTSNGPIDLDVWDVVHFRFGRNPYNDLLGMAPWASVNLEVYSDNEAAAYTASTLRNKGAAWMIVSPEGDAEFADSDQLRDKIENRITGDNRGRVLVLDGASKITLPPPYKDMGMLDVRRIPESRVAALAGIPGMCVGFASAQERSTFSNTDQADVAAWRTIMCVQRMMGRQLTKQVFYTPQNYSYRPNTFFVGFDYSEVRALQPDKTVEHKRVREDYDAGLLTEDEARIETGKEPFTAKQKAEVAERMKPPPPTVPNPNPSDPNVATTPATQPAKDIAGIVSKWRERKGNPNHDPHSGEFAPGGGGGSATASPAESPPVPATVTGAGPEQKVKDAARSQRAKQSATRTGAAEQRYSEEHNEAHLAKGLAGHVEHAGVPKSERDNEPVDVTIKNNGVMEHGVELKTMLSNKAGQISMKAAARARKTEWMADNKAPMHTVVFDDRKVYNANGTGKHDESKREMYYRRGFANFTLTSMHKVSDIGEIHKLMNTPTKDLPENAKPPKSYVEPL